MYPVWEKYTVSVWRDDAGQWWDPKWRAYVAIGPHRYPTRSAWRRNTAITRAINCADTDRAETLERLRIQWTTANNGDRR